MKCHLPARKIHLSQRSGLHFFEPCNKILNIVFCYILFFRGGNGLDWVSSIRCASLEETRQSPPRQEEKALINHSTKESYTTTREQKSEMTSSEVGAEREEKLAHVQSTIVYDTYDDFERIYMRRPLEMSLRMSVGAKKPGSHSMGLIKFLTFTKKCI